MATPKSCPACGGTLEVVRLHCTDCGTEVSGHFQHRGLLNLPEPYASMLEMFLSVRGNVKDMERLLGLSYPTVRARLDEAFAALGLAHPEMPAQEEDRKQRRLEIVRSLEREEISSAEAVEQLRELQKGRKS
ncbi:MAG TPA: DUF2089 domain-containing protein [Chloroflexota bacterium]|nr:DUF2089 domain-containing protein [Chloroflexota bacterium]